jgi:GTP-binding protein Era
LSAFRCGTIALVGRPNVGKSTLLNALVGSHLSITAAKPQTTRHRILGIRSEAEAQLIFLDTPGLHQKAPRALNRQLNRTAEVALDDVDALVFVLDARKWQEDDEWVLEKIKRSGRPVVLALNKIDKVEDKTQLLPLLERYAAMHEFAAMVPLAALKRQGMQPLVKALLKLLPEQPAMFAADELTDRSERFLAAEHVREQLIRHLGEELPYASTVTIDDFELDGRLRRINATIWVERDGQKAIVIGEGGARLKHVGSLARKRMEAIFGGKVFLQLWVKVKNNWSDSDAVLKQFGYT